MHRYVFPVLLSLGAVFQLQTEAEAQFVLPHISREGVSFPPDLYDTLQDNPEKLARLMAQNLATCFERYNLYESHLNPAFYPEEFSGLGGRERQARNIYLEKIFEDSFIDLLENEAFRAAFKKQLSFHTLRLEELCVALEAADGDGFFHSSNPYNDFIPNKIDQNLDAFLLIYLKTDSKEDRAIIQEFYGKVEDYFTPEIRADIHRELLHLYLAAALGASAEEVEARFSLLTRRFLEHLERAVDAAGLSFKQIAPETYLKYLESVGGGLDI